jgi:hypothetical protein
MNAKCLIPLALLIIEPLFAQEDPKQELGRVAAIANGAERLAAYDAFAVKLGVRPVSYARFEVAPGESAVARVSGPGPTTALPANPPEAKISQVYDAPLFPDYDMLRHHANLRNTWIRYHKAIAELDLAPMAQTRLVDLLCARVEAVNDAHDASVKMGDVDQQEVMKALSAAHHSVSAEISEMIGSSGLRQIEDARRAEDEQQLLVGSVGADLGLARVPMTEEQEAALGKIYAEVLSAPRNTAPDRFGQLPVDAQTGLSETDQGILDRATDVLSPMQVVALRKSMSTSHVEMRFLIAHGSIRVH